jgi:hypothetical protein
MCECAGYESAAEHVKEVKYAFLGEVLSSVTGSDGKAVTTFSAVEKFKGGVPNTVKIQHETDSAACGIEFDAFSKHLIFAVKRFTRYQTDQCEMPSFFPEDEYLRVLRSEAAA